MTCHGVDRQGSGNNPDLRTIKQDYDPDELLQLVNNGRRMMPSFRHLEEAQKKSIVNYLINEIHYSGSSDEPIKRSTSSLDATDVPYLMTGYENFETANGYPANSPPWGTLNAINLNTGEYVWRIPLGEYPELKARGIPPTGTPNYGGTVVTAGGLVFIAATPDKKIRAFNKMTGELMWEAELPAAGFATPSIYEVDGKQYLIIAAGGGKLNTRSGDTYVAFSLPE
jgi:quinoprotein glucose dehydrogenase